MSNANTNIQIPVHGEPTVNTNTGQSTRSWYRWFQNVTGFLGNQIGGQPNVPTITVIAYMALRRSID